MQSSHFTDCSVCLWRMLCTKWVVLFSPRSYGKKTIPHDRENWETNTTNDKYQLKTNRPRARRHSREMGIGEKLRAQLWWVSRNSNGEDIGLGEFGIVGSESGLLCWNGSRAEMSSWSELLSRRMVHVVWMLITSASETSNDIDVLSSSFLLK